MAVHSSHKSFDKIMGLPVLSSLKIMVAWLLFCLQIFLGDGILLKYWQPWFAHDMMPLKWHQSPKKKKLMAVSCKRKGIILTSPVAHVFKWPSLYSSAVASIRPFSIQHFQEGWIPISLAAVSFSDPYAPAVFYATEPNHSWGKAYCKLGVCRQHCCCLKLLVVLILFILLFV